jgi:hypothetical protein
MAGIASKRHAARPEASPSITNHALMHLGEKHKLQVKIEQDIVVQMGPFRPSSLELLYFTDF